MTNLEIVKDYLEKLSSLQMRIDTSRKNRYQYYFENVEQVSIVTPDFLKNREKEFEKTFYIPDIEIKQCYTNSIKAVLYNDDLDIKYVEGFYMIEGLPMPIEHAWCKYKDYYFDLTSKFWSGDIHINNYFKVVELDSNQISQWFKKGQNPWLTPMNYFLKEGKI